jgi:hypothetical protein
VPSAYTLVRMGFRNTLILVGTLLLITSWYLGDIAIWVGAPLIFLGISLKFLDIS